MNKTENDTLYEFELKSEFITPTMMIKLEKNDEYQLKCSIENCKITRKFDYNNFRDAMKCRFCHLWKDLTCGYNITHENSQCCVYNCRGTSSNIDSHLISHRLKCHVCDIVFLTQKICCWHDLNDYLKLPWQQMFKKCYVCSWTLCTFHYFKCRMCLKTFCDDHLNISDPQNKKYCDVCTQNISNKYFIFSLLENRPLNILVYEYLEFF